MAAILYTLLLIHALSVSCMANEEFTGGDVGDVLDDLNEVEARLNATMNKVKSAQNKVKKEVSVPRNCTCIPCQALYDAGVTTSGVYNLKPDGVNEKEVYCEQNVTGYGTGWMVFQRRFNGSVDFYRDWASYENGFGNAAGEHWQGLHFLWRYTGCQDTELLVELYNGTHTAYAHYSVFSVDDAASNYKLTVNGFSRGKIQIGDAMAYHSGSQFSTMDKDNDLDANHHCAQWSHGGFWYSSCYTFNPNGGYHHNNPKYIIWAHWGGHNQYSSSLPSVRMMIRSK